MERLLQDLVQSLRSLRRRPALVAVILLTAGLALGAATALADLANLVSWRRLPGGTDVVRVYSLSPHPFIGDFGYLTTGDFEDYARSSSAFSRIAGERTEGVVLTDSALGTHSLEAVFVTGDYFDILQLRAAQGRLLGPEDDQPSAPPAAVISHRLWTTLFSGTSFAESSSSIGSESSSAESDRVMSRSSTSNEVRAQEMVVGRVVRIGELDVTLAGVVPKVFPGSTTGSRTDIWLPMAWGVQLVDDWEAQPNRQRIDTIASLSSDWTPERAREELQVLATELDRVRELPNLERKISVVPGKLTHPLDQRNFQPILKMLAAAVGILLLLACANVANLLLARAVERVREMSLRMALGSSRSRLIRLLLIESSLLAMGSSAAGLLVVWTARRAMSAFDLETFAQDMQLDHRVVGAGLAATVGSTLLFGLAPALVATRTDLVAQLREGVQGFTRNKLRLFAGLAGLQIALATTLLLCTGLVASDLRRLSTSPLGFDESGLVRALIDLREWDYSADQATDFMTRLTERVSSLPEVTNAARTLFLPPLFLEIETRFRIPEDEPDDYRSSRMNFVGGNYFQTLGVGQIAGRTFDERERDGSGAVVINSRLAESLWPDSPAHSALGKIVHVEGADAQNGGPEYAIIGVVESITQHDLRLSAEPILYFSLDQRRRQITSLVARTSTDPENFRESLRAVIAEIDPRIGSQIRTSAERRHDALVVERLQAQSAAVLAVTGLLLSLVGIFGTLNLLVSARRRDLGVRKAVGASNGRLLRWVLKQCATIALAGIAVGTLLSLFAVRVLRQWISELPEPGADLYIAVPMLLLAAALCAGILPAARAARTQATEALRAE